MDKIGGAVIFATEKTKEFYMCKAIVAKDFSTVLEKALETNNTDAIKDATDKLTKVFYELSEKLYSQTQNAAGATETTGTTTDENGTRNLCACCGSVPCGRN